VTPEQIRAMRLKACFAKDQYCSHCHKTGNKQAMRVKLITDEAVAFHCEVHGHCSMNHSSMTDDERRVMGLID